MLATLARGWAFVSLEYRLAPQASLDELIEDVMDGCQFIQSGKLDQALGGGKVEGEKLALYGASAGEPTCAIPTQSLKVQDGIPRSPS